ncbi:hypothetical protein [Metallosphaera javensis (ex Sakai et al. 2022)]|uniref:hypothetical protein n=1 Tax=Metallosphaera javensis (ex Sakai et al. 2022) TaxID=2775498 RepID=UPI002584B9EC|nr:MAG: hypothetical protein MjAS7_2381 [Metallosphaera javensis (ex Sakai et al. 2022)]
MSKVTIESRYQPLLELIRIVFDPVFSTPAHKPVEEVEEFAMWEAEEVSPRYERGKKLKRRGYPTLPCI